MTEPLKETAEEPPRRKFGAAQIQITAFILIVAIGSAGFRVLHDHHLQQTAALYIGLPTLIAVALTLSRPAKDPYMMILKAISIVLLLSAPLLGEGFICILMISPLFYAIGLLVVIVVQSLKKRHNDKLSLSALILVPVLLMSAEGVWQSTTLPDKQESSATRTVAAAPEDVARALATPLAFDADHLPFYLSLGFPRPIASTGGELIPGMRQAVEFAGAAKRPAFEHSHHWGTNPTQLTFEVAESSPGHLKLRAVQDDTPIATWVHWNDAEISWKSVGENRTEITWTLHFDRKLAPAWYFGPWESYGVSKAADYLLHSLVIPQ